MNLNLTEIIFLFILLFCYTKSEKCQYFPQPENGFFIGGYCSNSVGSICGIKCFPGYTLLGSSFRKCEIKNNIPFWTGVEPYCRINQCKQLKHKPMVISNCTDQHVEYGTKCHFFCPHEYQNIGSSFRICLAIGIWTGLDANCIKSLNPYISKLIETTSKPTFLSQIMDLSQYSFSFGYSFKKISLDVKTANLPITFGIWLRTNYTKNIKVINYYNSCFNISILSNENSSLIVDFSFYQDKSLNIKSYYFDLNKYLVRNIWTQIIFLHSEENFRIFLNGVPELSLDEFNHIFNLTNCFSYLKENEFLIRDDLVTTENDFFQPLRGEITKVFLYNFELTEEEIIYNFFKCDIKRSHYNQSLVIFDWTKVLIDDYLFEFKRKKTTFCKNCNEPELIKHAFMYYDGTKTGDVLLYECQKGYTMVGQSTSVCMVYGLWSHKTPRCKAQKNGSSTIPTTKQIVTKDKEINGGFIQIIDENSILKWKKQFNKRF